VSQAAATPYHQFGDEGCDTGIRCQLLNPVEAGEVNTLIASPHYCLQEKFDGRRLLVRKRGEEITGINRRGLVVAIPEPIREAVSHITCDVLLDGEAVGETLHAFDLLEFNGSDIRRLGYLERFKILMGCIPPGLHALHSVSTAIDPDDKLESFEELRITNREGVVFKDIKAPSSPGRPNSRGPQLKFKFVETASFVVTGHNAKRSVTLGLTDGNKLVPAGNVTIPPNHPVPDIGDVCEIRYLYALKQSGCVYQPVYFGKRTDIPAAECLIEQLKFKPQAKAA
jgi:bifunctional non-homologous end joining protein LigD